VEPLVKLEVEQLLNELQQLLIGISIMQVRQCSSAFSFGVACWPFSSHSLPCVCALVGTAAAVAFWRGWFC